MPTPCTLFGPKLHNCNYASLHILIEVSSLFSRKLFFLKFVMNFRYAWYPWKQPHSGSHKWVPNAPPRLPPPFTPTWAHGHGRNALLTYKDAPRGWHSGSSWASGRSPLSLVSWSGDANPGGCRGFPWRKYAS